MDQDSSDFGYFAPSSVGRDDFYSENSGGLAGITPLYDIDENTRESATPEIEECESNSIKTMGIENTWADDVDSFSTPPSADYPIPLGPPGGFDNMACLDPAPPGEPGTFADSGLGMLFSGETEMQDDMKDTGAEPGVCGLRNMGNTCFMGAGLQCMAATPPMVEFFLARNVEEKDRASHCLTDQFSILIHKMWSGNFGIIRPYEFKQALGINHPQFKDYRQHDCQEFLALLLDNLHEQLNTASGKSNQSEMSTAPATPHSQCEMDERDSVRKSIFDTSDADLPGQISTLTDCPRSNHSSSSHSSESSGEARAAFRLQPIPEGVTPFKEVVPLKPKEMEMNLHDVDSLETAKERDDSGHIFSALVVPEDGVQSSNNVVSPNALVKKKEFHKSNVVDPALEKNVANQLNNIAQGFRGLQDILKDAKTSNVNVLVTEPEANNEIRFDSEKYPKYEGVRRRDTLENPNLTEFHNFDSKIVSVKRIKETNIRQESAESAENVASGQQVALDSDKCFNNIKRMKLEDQEKNFRMEQERKLRDMDADVVNESSDLMMEDVEAASTSSYPVDLNDEIEADKHWDRHVSLNQSVVAESFQGQFKSTVVCLSCKHVSITYEPFMYLSVPLPHAMERQICVTFVSCGRRRPVKYLVTLNKQEKVRTLKEELAKYTGGASPRNVALAEVLDSHISKILEENLLLRYVNDTNRTIYAFELSPPPQSVEDHEDLKAETGPTFLDGAGDMMIGHAGPPSPVTLAEGCGGYGDGVVAAGPLTEGEYQRLCSVDKGTDSLKCCAICLEHKDSDVRRHINCSCILCESCIQSYHQHMGKDTVDCPVCGENTKPETEFIELNKAGDFKPTIRLLDVPVVFRLDTDGDGNNNKKKMTLFGHPNLLRLPNRLMGRDLYRAVEDLVPSRAPPYLVLLVDGQGYHCSRCIYTEHCRGCRVASEGEVLLQNSDTLAVRFTEPVEDSTTVAADHPSMLALRSQDPLSLYDCLQAFSESEQLDEHNPWYCPVCQKNQCATKTLSVWRYPDYLIVYLKRFIFHDSVSIKLENKVTFPLSGLSMTSPSLLQHDGLPPYNLYACVCHFGGSSAGHYTAYAKNPRTEEWHHFNDELVTKQKPQEEDYNNAYILFYQKQGASPERRLAC